MKLFYRFVLKYFESRELVIFLEREFLKLYIITSSNVKRIFLYFWVFKNVVHYFFEIVWITIVFFCAFNEFINKNSIISNSKIVDIFYSFTFFRWKQYLNKKFVFKNFVFYKFDDFLNIIKIVRSLSLLTYKYDDDRNQLKKIDF